MNVGAGADGNLYLTADRAESRHISDATNGALIFALQDAGEAANGLRLYRVMRMQDVPQQAAIAAGASLLNSILNPT